MSAPALVAHLSMAELGQRYRAARQPIERSHLQMVWLLSQGRSEREVVAVTGYSARWITEIVRRYNAEGTSGLGDQRAKNTGARPLLSPEDEVALRDALAEPPADGGLWTGPKVAAWMSARLGHKIWPQRGWDYLRKLGYSSQVPRPRHAKAASAEEQEAFKRGSRAGSTSAAPRTPRGRSRSGPSTSIASVRSRSCDGNGRPRASARSRLDSTATSGSIFYGFVHPSTGAVVWFVCTTVDTDLLGAVLAAFGRAIGAGKDKLIVLDQAGWHVSDKLVIPDGIVLEFLPSYTPELQPAERLWPLTNEAVANKHFATLKELDIALSTRCRALVAEPEIIKAQTHFGGWPATAVPNRSAGSGMT